MRIRLLPYNLNSKGGRDLAEELDILRIRPQNSSFVPRQGDLVFCWGNTNANHFPAKVYNRPEFVRDVTNKLNFFRKAASGEGFQTPPFTTNRREAAEWPICVARTVLTGHEGAGIIITEHGEEPPRASLYTKYIKKRAEYRIHIAFGRIIDMQRKIRRPDGEPTDWRIRSWRNGFIFARNSGIPSETSQRAALAAMTHFELDYGAIDLVETRDGDTYILEINSAPGLEGGTLERYARAFRREIESRREINRRPRPTSLHSTS